MDVNDPPRVAPATDKRMTREDVEATLKMQAMAAESYIESDLSPSRVEALKLYNGDPLGNEQEGRSQIVIPTVRNAILAAIPPLLRASFGPEPAVGFVPQRADLVAQSEQQSDYISLLIRENPDALLNMQSVIMDGLLCRTGFIKTWWEPYQQAVTYTQTGITGEQLALYGQDDSITYAVTNTTVGEDGQPRYDCSVTKQMSGRARWAAIPPEEVLWNRDARSWEDTTFMAHRKDRTVGECVADGFDYDDLIEFAKAAERIDWAEERAARQLDGVTADVSSGDNTADPSLWRLAFYEAYARVDEDGDRIPELRKYYMVGPFQPIKKKGDTSPFVGEATPWNPMHGWCPYPMPHTPVGMGIPDLIKGLQKLDTAVMRATIDSLGLALNERMAMQEGMVNQKDVVNTEVGAIIRTKGRPADNLQVFGHRFVGKESFGLMMRLDEERERSTGRNMESQGLNADALQSSTKQGVAATLSAAAARDELMTRLLAENILRPLARDFYRLTKLNQQESRVVRMSGGWVTVDPRVWDEDCEVKVNLGLGMGLAQERLERIQAILAKQEQVLGTLGPANPIVGLDQYTSTLHKGVKLAGDADAESFFHKISEAEAQQMRQQASQQPPKEDPAAAAVKMQAEAQMLQAQVAQGRLQLDMQKAQQEAQLAEQKLQLDYEFKQEQLRQEFALKTQEMELRYQSNVQEANLDAFIRGREHQANLLEAGEKAQIQQATDVYKADKSAESAATVAAIKAQADIVKAEKSAANKPIAGDV